MITARNTALPTRIWCGEILVMRALHAPLSLCCKSWLVTKIEVIVMPGWHGHQNGSFFSSWSCIQCPIVLRVEIFCRGMHVCIYRAFLHIASVRCVCRAPLKMDCVVHSVTMKKKPTTTEDKPQQQPQQPTGYQQQQQQQSTMMQSNQMSQLATHPQQQQQQDNSLQKLFPLPNMKVYYSRFKDRKYHFNFSIIIIGFE